MTTSTPAPTPQTPPGPAPQLAGSRVGELFVRGLLILAGLGFVVGFFLPWLHLGTLAALSGFALLVADGEVVSMLSGPHRVMLFGVPLFGVGLIVGAVYGHRITAWLALLAGIAVIIAGLVTLVMVFLDTTGTGMWLVAVSALVALGTGMLSVGAQRR